LLHFLVFFTSQADISALGKQIFAIFASLDRNLLRILVYIQKSGTCAPKILHGVKNCTILSRFSRPQSRSIGHRIVTKRCNFSTIRNKPVLRRCLGDLPNLVQIGPPIAENHWPKGVPKKSGNGKCYTRKLITLKRLKWNQSACGCR